MDKKKKTLLSIGIAIVAVIVVFNLYILFVNRAVDSENEKDIRVKIANGSTTSDIISILDEKKLIRSTTGFKIISKLFGFDGKYLAGVYDLNQSMSVFDIIDIIVNGKNTNLSVTIVEGYTIDDIAATLAEKGLAGKDGFINEAARGNFNYPFLKGLPKDKNRLEGFIYPDTYSIAPDTSAHDIIDMFLSEFNKKVYQKYKDKVVSKYKFYDVLKVASIIEKEAGNDNERPIVASVVFNRLNKGIKLQMCSTVSFFLRNGNANLTNEDISRESPYNTYIHEGLPPTPIGSPSLKSVEAAFNPAKTDYLYFVLSDKLDGTTKFSSDYEQFEKDKKAYYDAYDKKRKDDE